MTQPWTPEINGITMCVCVFLCVFFSLPDRPHASHYNRFNNRQAGRQGYVSMDVHATADSDCNVWFSTLGLHCLPGVWHVCPSFESDKRNQECGIRAPGEHGGHWWCRAPDRKPEIQGWSHKLIWRAAAVCDTDTTDYLQIMGCFPGA